jgi:hypothetical protein
MEHTCGNCEEIKFDKNSRWAVAGCKLTDLVIPHFCEHDKKRLTFWRIPNDCPRPDTEVKKSERQARQNQWVIKKFSDF